MPVKTGKDDKGCFAQWGSKGKKYYYTCGDDTSMGKAKNKAYLQRLAATGETLKEQQSIEWTEEQYKEHNEFFDITEQEKKAQDKPGGSNAGKYPNVTTFCGPSGGAPAGTYPVNTKKRAISALAYARNAPNPAGIKACVCRHYPDLAACQAKKEDSFIDSQESSFWMNR